MGILCSISAFLICTAFFQECNPGIKRDLPVVFNFQGLGGIPFASSTPGFGTVQLPEELPCDTKPCYFSKNFILLSF